MMIQLISRTLPFGDRAFAAARLFIAFEQ